MNRVQVWVNIPEGYELACDEMRLPKDGEMYVVDGGCVCVAEYDWQHLHRLIVRPTWQWPAWLKARWLWCCSDNTWFAGNSNNPPELMRWGWYTGGHTVLINDHEDLFDFTPPPCTDWRESLRENPNWKDGAAS
jgi:hypothetical protein